MTLPAGAESQRARRAWDLNGDARIDRGERSAALDRLYAKHCAGMAVSLDGRPGAVRRGFAEGGGLIGPVERDEAISVSFGLVLDLPADDRKHELSLRDSSPGGGHMPAALQAGQGMEIVAHDGVEQRRGQRRQVVGLLGASRSLSVAFRLLRQTP